MTEEQKKPAVVPPQVVLVPMKLDAFVLNKATCKGNFKLAALQQPDYKSLRPEAEFLEPDVLSSLDLFNANEENTRLFNAGTGEPIPGREGIYLHWVLPQCYRHAVTATEDRMHDHTLHKLKRGFFDGKGPDTGDEEPESLQLTLRSCPNRYMVTRILEVQNGTEKKAYVDCFMIESDRVRFIGAIPFSEDVEVECSPFLDPEVPLERQAEVFLGKKQNADDWNEDEFALRHSPLTVLDCANPLFADYQPHNAGVFSLRDDLSYWDGTAQSTRWESCTANYYVMGWHTEEHWDPFHLHPSVAELDFPPMNSERLKDCFMTLAPGPGARDHSEWLNGQVAGRALCHGAIYGVQAHKTNRVGGSAVDDLQKSLTEDHPLAVGETALDALVAWLRRKGADADATTPEGQILALQSLLLGREEDPDGQAQAEEQLSFDHFRSENGETHFHFTAAVGQKGEEVFIPSPEVLMQLEELNDLMTLYDAAVREVKQLRWELFSEWWKAVTLKPKLGESDSSLLARKKVISDSVKKITEQLDKLISVEAFGNEDESTASGFLVKGIQAIEEKKSGLEADQNIIDAQVALELGAGERYYIPRDPTVLVAGVSSGWPSKFDEPLGVRVDSQINTNIGVEPLYFPQEGGPETFGTGESKRDYYRRLAHRATYWWWVKGIEDGSLPTLDAMAVKLSKNTSPLLNITWSLDGRSIDEPRKFPAYADTLSLKLPPALQNAAKKLLRWEFPFFGLKGPAAPGRMDYYQGLVPTYYADGDTWTGQPLCPLFIEWEVEYWHIDFEHWEFVPDNGVFRWALKSDTPVVHMRNDRRVLSGRSLVSPEAQLSLIKAVKELLDTTPVSQDVTLERYQQEKQQQDLFASLKALKYFSSALDGFRDQLITRVRETHIKPSILSEDGKVNESLLQKLADEFGIQGTHLKKMEATSETTPFASLKDIAPSPGPDTPCPFKPVTHGQFRFTKYHIVDKFGQVVTAPNPLHPCTSAQYSLNTLESGHPNSMHGTAPGEESEFVQVPPSINQPARWNSEFMVPDDTAPGSWKVACEYDNPIWGWLMIDYTDRSIQVFRPDGTFLIEIGLHIGGVERINIRSSPLRPDSLTSDAPPTQLDLFLRHLLPSPEKPTPALPFAIFSTMSKALEDGSLAIPKNNLTDNLPATIGRPIALVNMAWSLELSLPPAENESSIIPGGPAPGSQLFDYSFPAKFGDAFSRRDGLVGYFTEQPETSAEHRGRSTDYEFDYTKLFTYFIEEGEDTEDEVPPTSTTGSSNDDPRELISAENLPTFKPFYVAPSSCNSAEDFAAKRKAELRVFPALIDPFTPVHCTSGILPPSPLAPPAWAIERALRNLKASIRVGPTLLPIDAPGFRQDRVPRPVASVPPVIGVPPAAIGAAAAEIEDNTVVEDAPAGPAPGAVQDETKLDGLPIPAATGGEWIWLQPYAPALTERSRTAQPGEESENELLWNAFAICPGDSMPRMDERGVLSVVEGYLELTRPLGVTAPASVAAAGSSPAA